MRRLTRIAMVSLVWILAAGAARAQTGGLVVHVADADGTPLAGATVTLSNVQSLIAPAGERSDSAGTAVFPVLRAGGGYVIEVALAGFATRRMTDLRVSSDRVTQVDVRMAEELRERVEVVGRSDVVDLDSTASTTRFGDEFIDELPVADRFYQNILTLAPGVKDTDGDGNPNVHGARQRDFQAQVGGVSNVDPLTGEWLSYVNADSIEDLEIVTTGAGVEFGRASGGFARIVQKQGSNRFEGTSGLLYRSWRLDGEGAGSGGPAINVPEFRSFQPSVQVSGPIVRDRLWYRLSHELIDRQDPVVFPDRVEISQRRQSMNADQLTWQISPRNKLALQFQSDPLTQTNYGLEARLPGESTQRLERGGDTWSLSWTAPLSPRLLVDSMVAWQDHHRGLTPSTVGVPFDCPLRFYFTFESLNDAQCTNLDTNRVSGSSGERSADRRQRLTVRSQATIYRGRLFGTAHRFTFGLSVENERYYLELERAPLLSIYTKVDPFTEVRTGFVDVRVSVPRQSQGRATGVAWALWLEDQVRLTDRLVLTAGVRFDREEIDSQGHRPFDPASEFASFLALRASGLPTQAAAPLSFTAFENIAAFQDQLGEALGVPSDQVPLGTAANDSAFWATERMKGDIALAMNNLAPRLSLAWDPLGDGKTKLAVSFGRYYDKTVLAVPLLEVEPPETELSFRAVQFGDDVRLAAFTPAGGVNPAVDTRLVDRGLRTPYQDEFTASIERELWPESSAKLTYIRRRYRDQFQDIDINHAPGDFGRCVVSDRLGQPVVVKSPGEGDLLVDPYTGVEFVDSDPGPGDGVIDDCTGDIVHYGGYFGYDDDLPDGLPDLYVLNPGWGELLQVGNYNLTDYESWVVEIVRRLYRGWQLDLNYTWSKAIGNGEDFSQVLGNESTLYDDEFGYLDFDQRHVAQLTAVTRLRGGLRLGGSVRWESGLPFSELTARSTLFAVPEPLDNLGDHDLDLRYRYPTHQRNDQRNPSFWTIDARVARDIRLSRDVFAQLSVEVFNLLNDGNPVLEDRFNGENSGGRRFGRRFQVGVKLTF